MALDLLQLKHFLYIITVIGLLPLQAQQGSQDRNYRSTPPSCSSSDHQAVSDSPQPRRLLSCALDPVLPHWKCDSLIQIHLGHYCTIW